MTTLTVQKATSWIASLVHDPEFIYVDEVTMVGDKVRISYVTSTHNFFPDGDWTYMDLPKHKGLIKALELFDQQHSIQQFLKPQPIRF